jgi:hypothetical protein
MKDIWLLALIALVFSVGICTAEVPNLVGNWTGSGVGYSKGAFEEEANGSISLNVTEQMTGFSSEMQRSSRRMDPSELRASPVRSDWMINHFIWRSS